MRKLRAIIILFLFMVITLALMPVQLVRRYVNSRRARSFPHWYHRQLCRLLGVRIRRKGKVAEDRPVLLISNHISWLDIPVLSALAPVSFVAKAEVAGWPFISWLAKLQDTIFVNRARRLGARNSADGITARTPADGVCVQSVAIAYTHQQRLPLGRRGRPFVAWYGDMDIASHAWKLLKCGPLDVSVHIGEPVMARSFSGRKELARFTEDQVRRAVADILAPRNKFISTGWGQGRIDAMHSP